MSWVKYDRVLGLLDGYVWTPYSFTFYVDPAGTTVRATMAVGNELSIVLDYTKARGWFAWSVNSNGMRKIAELPSEPTSALVLAIWRRRLQLEKTVERLHNILSFLNYGSMAHEEDVEEEIGMIDTLLQLSGVNHGLKDLRAYIQETMVSLKEIYDYD